MRGSKRARLEAKGWRVGSTAEFLNLSPEEAAYVELMMKLASKSREWRARRRLTHAVPETCQGVPRAAVADKRRSVYFCKNRPTMVLIFAMRSGS